MAPPHERLAALLRVMGWTQGAAAERFKCSQVMVSQILAGTKLPGRLIANAIERESVTWIDGPLRSEEWDAVEEERKHARTGTDG